MFRRSATRSTVPIVQAGIVSPRVGSEDVATLLEEYLTFLQHHRGLREGTLYFHRRWGERFLHHLAQHLPNVDLTQLTVPIVDAFVLPLARTVGRGTQWQMIQAVRGMLRHLHRTGRVVEDWSRFVQGPRRYRLASIPTTISMDEVRRLLATIDRRSAISRRNYAILLLLAVYGLRAREVIELRVDDVDWRGGIIRVRRSKTSRPLVLPLTSSIGSALAAYLRHGRPPTDAREIFVRHRGTATAFRKSSNVFGIVQRAFDRAGIGSVRRGPHVLRHALATHLVQRGFPLHVAANLLGHQHPDSTLPYTKLAIEDLREVALEVPEFDQ
jgi:site-specific recombinase XerD